MGSVGLLPDFEFYMAVFGIPSGPVGLVAPLRFKILDSLPDSSNMGSFPIDVHDFRVFRKSAMASWPGTSRVFGPTVPKSAFRVF